MLNVVLRTCDRHSLQSTRIVHKKECILRCLNSILTNLNDIEEKHLHIIDDYSSEDFVKKLHEIVKPFPFVTVNYLPERNQSKLSPKKKSRYSVQVAYDYIYNLPDEDLVYIVEDDYLHFPGAIKEMVETWKYLSDITQLDVGIFPQDFNQLYYDPKFPYNDTYFKPCFVVPCKNRYYRTTWYTQESFMIKSNVFKKYRSIFDSLLTIGDNEVNWEGNTISNLWMRNDFKMFMPMGSLVLHMSNVNDIPFFITKQQVIDLWEFNKTEWSTEQHSILNIN